MRLTRNEVCAHEYNLDLAQREIDRREAEGEDMTGARIDPVTYAIVKRRNEALIARGKVCPDCGGERTESNGAGEYRCVDCDHRWGRDMGERYGY